LDSAKIIHTGTFKDSLARANTYPLIIDKNGIRIALLNYTYGTNGIPVPQPAIVNPIDTVLIKHDIQRAKDRHPDAILVLLHFGDEYQRSPNRFQKRVANLCFREGAQLVIGSHPHVIQPIEFFPEKNQLVAWSLGNFISNQRPRYRNGGLMLWVDLDKIRTDSVTSVTRIANASYDLAYVHVNKRKKFHLLPVTHPQVDSLLRTDSLALKTYTEFASDSRQWLRQHNRHVNESTALWMYAVIRRRDTPAPANPAGCSFMWDDVAYPCESLYATRAEAEIVRSLIQQAEPDSNPVIQLVRAAIDRKTEHRLKTPDR
jgi:poly-gamma-glutamate synthesis protein (capsule biosynthesis protein)